MRPCPAHLAQLLQRSGQFPVVALLGARQVGKTTLTRQLAASCDGPVKHSDLDDRDDQARLSDPAFTLRPLTGLVVLDESEVLDLEQLSVVCHGEGAPWQLGDGIAAVPVGSLDACVTDDRNVAPLLIPNDRPCP